ncbi:MAG: carboxypeptidase-like regulatory domain-containing protein [Planctomycetaceae bacterium]|nr:carboxypeptidase-like regulatory domain-containing protein [Planctomycetaceae bacterium]
MNKNFLTIFALLFSVAFMAGCGDPKVTGKVTFPDGAPLTKGQVMFQKGGFVGSGDIQKDGTYSAGKLKDGDGLPPGQYQVFITGASTFDAAEMEKLSQEATIGRIPTFKTPRPIDLIATKYMSPRSSDLTVEVNGRTKYDITVEAPK